MYPKKNTSAGAFPEWRSTQSKETALQFKTHAGKSRVNNFGHYDVLR